MNKAYRLIWSESLGGWVAVSETAMGRGKGAGGKRRIRLLARRAGLAAALATAALASGVAQANFVGDGGSANGTNAIAVGNGASTGGSNSTGGVAIGAGAQSSAGNADGNIAIGENAKNLNQIGGGGAIVIGRNATILNYNGNPIVTGAGSLVIGDGASSYGINTVVLGAGANVNHSTNIAIGYQATGTGNGGVVALGKGSNATGDNSVAIGGSAVVTGTNGMAIGNGSQAAANATSLGAVATALGTNATAIGQQATAATNGTAVGTTARANGANAMAVGNAASAEASATAIGTAAKASGTNSTALGNGASATANNSVAIGAGSKTAMTLPTTGGYNPGNTALAGTAPFSEASFGTAGQERLLTNVAAGQLATDAVNVSQLMSASDKIDHAGISAAAALGGGAAYDPTSGSISAPTFNLGSNGTYSNVGDAMSSLFNTGTKYFHANSAGADSQATGTNSVAIGVGAVSANADDVALGANSKTAAAVATTGATIGGTAYTFAGTAPASTVSVGDVGAERTVTNMAAGRLSATSTDGVNGSQLYATNQAVNQIETRVDTLGDQSVKYDTNADGTVNYNAVTLAGAVSSDGGKTGGTRIRNVAQGEVSATSADAVNGAQLYAVQGDITNLGDDIDNIYEKGTKYFHANSTGLDSQALGMNAIAIGMNSISLGANALAAGANANAAGANALALGAGAQAGNTGDVALGAGSKTAAAVGTASASIGGNTYNFAGASPTSTVSVGDVGSERTITNVAAGRLDGNSTDAVNGSQLAATNQAVNVISTTVNTLNDRAVQYGVNSDGTVDYSTVTLAGTKSSDGGKTGGTRITNLSQGDLSATSTDAVNGAQLYETNQNVTNIANEVNNIYNTGSKYFHANSTGADSVASGADSVAAGTGAVANNAGDVALGANSVTAAAVATTGTTINGQRYSFAGTSPTSTVSVGDAGSERTITNVAAGRVSATSTDAVNGSQLYATDQAIESLAGKAVQYDTNADGTVNYSSVTMGATASQDGGKTGGTRIRNVAQGDVSAISTDAVNGAQLYNITGDTSATYITENGTGVKYVRTNDTGLPAADAHAQGEGATAVGYEAVAAAKNDVATGYRALASGGNSVAQGANAQATGNASVAVGSGAVATGANSVALGAGSAASRDNSVSVGAVGNERQITNVAAGTADTDAVNVSQLHQTQNAANSYTDQQVGNVRKDAYGGTASAMAMAALPQSTLPGKGMAAIAGGTYGGQSAMALGLSAMSDSGRWVYRANATTNTRGNVGVAVGAGFHW